MSTFLMQKATKAVSLQSIQTPPKTKKPPLFRSGFWEALARWTGLEPATPGVTGRYSNQLSYHRAVPCAAIACGVGGYYAGRFAPSSGVFGFFAAGAKNLRFFQNAAQG
jgi:hypothetical protein